MEQQTATVETPPATYSTVEGWLNHRADLWHRFELCEPDEKRELLKILERDRLSFEAETKRIRK